VIRGIGIDIVHVDRIREAMENPKFLERILTPQERQMELTPERVASRWAGKEALYKAAGGGFSWQDLSLMGRTNNSAELVWVNQPDSMKNVRVMLSLSHERLVAVAVAVILVEAE